MHTARFAAEQNRPLLCRCTGSAAAEPVGEQDEGTQALLTLPAKDLPEG